MEVFRNTIVALYLVSIGSVVACVGVEEFLSDALVGRGRSLRATCQWFEATVHWCALAWLITSIVLPFALHGVVEAERAELQAHVESQAEALLNMANEPQRVEPRVMAERRKKWEAERAELVDVIRLAYEFGLKDSSIGKILKAAMDDPAALAKARKSV